MFDFELPEELRETLRVQEQRTLNLLDAMRSASMSDAPIAAIDAAEQTATQFRAATQPAHETGLAVAEHAKIAGLVNVPMIDPALMKWTAPAAAVPPVVSRRTAERVQELRSTILKGERQIANRDATIALLEKKNRDLEIEIDALEKHNRKLRFVIDTGLAEHEAPAPEWFSEN